ncbi:MAG TPA: hypothetical protein PLY87_01415 [Planctomycetaceae bacterium]|nr:hypothetical protein [Planctomycetaceae bacterium]HRA89153.1 hypothetical protein [Planctomycetaceae bacterium]
MKSGTAAGKFYANSLLSLHLLINQIFELPETVWRFQGFAEVRQMRFALNRR